MAGIFPRTDALCNTWQLQARARVKEIAQYPSILFDVKSPEDHMSEGLSRTSIKPLYVSSVVVGWGGGNSHCVMSVRGQGFYGAVFCCVPFTSAGMGK